MQNSGLEIVAGLINTSLNHKQNVIKEKDKKVNLPLGFRRIKMILLLWWISTFLGG